MLFFEVLLLLDLLRNELLVFLLVNHVLVNALLKLRHCLLSNVHLIIANLLETFNPLLLLVHAHLELH